MAVDSTTFSDENANADEILKKYFPSLTKSQNENFSKLSELYQYWNERINLISRKDIDHLMLHHVLHSLFIAKLVTFKPGSKIIDVGTGGGFPGLPLAILFPEVEFLLVDSVGKKINVVNEIVTALNLQNVTAVKCRAEQLETNCDFIVSRAVTSLSELFSWTNHLIKKGGSHSLRNGWLILKGGDFSIELYEVNRPTEIFEIGNFYTEEYFKTKKVVYMSA